MIGESLRIRPRSEAEWLGPMALDDFWGARAGRRLEVDVGSGKGRFLLARAGKFPETNFLGIDRMLRRIRKVDNRARRADLGNIRLLRAEGYYAVTYLLPAGAVDEMYVFFPDPWPKARHEGNRLFNGRFLDAVWRVLKPGGGLHFATDHAPYFEAVAELLRGDGRFAETEAFVPAEDERTDFELYYIQNKPIGRISLRRK